MTHSFETEDAERYGVNAAIILANLRFWIAKNKANKRHEHDGLTWTYNSVKAFSELFPYLSAKQIRTAIQKLVDAGEIKEGNFNKSSYDRTKWYCLLNQNDLPKKENPFALEGKPIPDSKQDSKPDEKQDRGKAPAPKPSSENPVKDKITGKRKTKVEIPSVEEVIDEMKIKLPKINDQWTPERVRKATELKYETCVGNGWKDGYGNAISNWKLKFVNMMKFEKPWTYSDKDAPGISDQRRQQAQEARPF